MSDRASRARVLAPGRYQHYKGGMYDVVGVAQHESAGDVLVIYRPIETRAGLVDEADLWARPLEDFLSKVTTAAGVVSRFRLVVSESDN